MVQLSRLMMLLAAAALPYNGVLAFSIMPKTTTTPASSTASSSTTQNSLEVVSATMQKWVGSACLVATLALGSIPTAASAAAAVSSPSRAVSIDVDVPTNIPSIVRLVQDNRKTLTDAVKDTQAALTPVIEKVAPAVKLSLPEDTKGAVRDALAGEGTIKVNDEPFWVTVQSEKGSLTVRVASPLFPKLPLLEPVPVEGAAPKAEEPKEQKKQLLAAGSSFWEQEFRYNSQLGLNMNNREAVIKGGAVGIVGAYGLSYAFYSASNAMEEAQANRKKEEKKKKAADKKKQEKKTTAAPAVTPVAAAAATEPATDVATKEEKKEPVVVAATPSLPTEEEEEVDDEDKEGGSKKRDLFRRLTRR